MAWHTAEPWRVGKFGGIYGDDGPCLGGCSFSDGSQRPNGRENETRIVACVNACAGIDDPADLRRQRDELLQVLKEVNDNVEEPLSWIKGDDPGMWDRVETAIAKAEGEK